MWRDPVAAGLSQKANPFLVGKTFRGLAKQACMKEKDFSEFNLGGGGVWDVGVLAPSKFEVWAVNELWTKLTRTYRIE